MSRAVGIRRRCGAWTTTPPPRSSSTWSAPWLLDRQERCGFRICEKPDSKRLLPQGTTYKKHPHHGDRYELLVRDQRNLSFAKPRSNNASRRRPVTLVAVTSDGRLEVTDPDLLRRTLVQGLGWRLHRQPHSPHPGRPRRVREAAVSCLGGGSAARFARGPPRPAA
ncbi:type I-E CRISPR-associated protein Cas6/Cse3/CasE [Streptomyces sp. NBC_00024]|uniref:type I-E CRISPR-associated protein Cas6/Cse3/CasE n=1 Tax=Streptomyces sp. NBC_00024 TaxID=2903612 RepID=UPI00386E138D